MKLKARDIVKGWPRGRTTCSFSQWTPTGWTTMDKPWWSLDDVNALLKQAAFEMAYQREQKKMFDKFLDEKMHELKVCAGLAPMFPISRLYPFQNPVTHG